MPSRASPLAGTRVNVGSTASAENRERRVRSGPFLGDFQVNESVRDTVEALVMKGSAVRIRASASHRQAFFAHRQRGETRGSGCEKGCRIELRDRGAIDVLVRAGAAEERQDASCGDATRLKAGLRGTTSHESQGWILRPISRPNCRAPPGRRLTARRQLAGSVAVSEAGGGSSASASIRSGRLSRSRPRYRAGMAWSSVHLASSDQAGRHARGRLELGGAEAELGSRKGGEEGANQPVTDRLVEPHPSFLQPEADGLEATRAARSRSTP